MSAACRWCAVGLTSVSGAVTAPRDPLGACWECHAFACDLHAQWDPGPGKWLCLPTLAQALSAGAGVDEISESIAFRSSEEFVARAPELAAATKRDRQFFRSGAGERWLGEVMDDPRFAPRRKPDFMLLADAVGVGRFLERSVRSRPAIERRAPQPVLAGLLGELVSRAPDG